MTHTPRRPSRRTRPPHAQIHLPPLTAGQALLLVNLLDRAIAAIWRTHREQMADLRAGEDPEAAVWSAPADVVAATAGPLADEPF